MGACAMIFNNITNKVLFDPIGLDVNELYIVSGYATPILASFPMRFIMTITGTV